MSTIPLGHPLSVTSTPSEDERHFRTDHLQADLKGRSVRGGATTLVAQACKFVLQVGSTAILARVLTPQDYGLIAMVAVFTGFIGLFKDLGLSMATVQRRDITHVQVTALFWINVTLSLALSAISMGLAPIIAWIYAEPRLLGITVAISATFVLGGLASQHIALLRRQMRFQLLAIIDTCALIIGIFSGIAFAYLGAGYWALVWMIAIEEAVTVVLVWTSCSWRPTRPTRCSQVGPMIRFGAGLTAFHSINYLARNADNALVGWWSGPKSLGIYAKAYQLMLLPLTQINSRFNAIVTPALSRLQDQPERFRRAYREYLSVVCAIAMPVAAFLITAADEVVLAALGSQWADAGPILRILGWAAFLQVPLNPTGAVLTATGRSDRLWRAGLVNSALTITAFAIGLPHGPKGVAVAYVTYTSIAVAPILLYQLKPTPVHFRDVLKAVIQPLLASAIVAASVCVAKWLTTDAFSPPVQLGVCAIVALAMWSVSTLIMRGPGNPWLVLRHVRRRD